MFVLGDRIKDGSEGLPLLGTSRTPVWDRSGSAKLAWALTVWPGDFSAFKYNEQVRLCLLPKGFTKRSLYKIYIQFFIKQL